MPYITCTKFLEIQMLQAIKKTSFKTYYIDVILSDKITQFKKNNELFKNRYYKVGQSITIVLTRPVCGMLENLSLRVAKV